MYKRIIKYFGISTLFIAFVFFLHQMTATVVFPHMTQWEYWSVVIVTFALIVTTIMWQVRKRYDILKKEKNTSFESLLETEKEFRALFEDNLTGNFITDARGSIIDVNQSFLDIFGYDSKDEIIGKENSFLYPDLSEYDFVINELRINGKIKDYKTIRKKKNGELIHVCENVIAKIDEVGNIVKIKCYVYDKTNEVTAEKLLQESERKYRQVLDSIPSAFHFFRLSDDKLIFTGTNPAASGLINIPAEEFIGKTIEECFPNLTKEIPDLYKKVAKGELNHQSFEIDYKDDRLSGVYAVTLFKTDQNEIAANITDITESKAEEKKQVFLKNILETLNKRTDWKNSVKIILSELKQFSNLDAVGIRLERENDFPYYVQEGFSEAFLKAENSLCSRNRDGSIKFSSDGTPVLECTCGMILSDNLDLSQDYATPNGSLWTNHSTDFLSTPPEEEQRLNPRNTCIHHGYMSVLLVPLKIGEKTVGLLQMNNKEPGKFSKSDITFYEEIGSIIGIAYEKILSEQSLKDNEEMFSQFMDHLPAVAFIKDKEGKFIYGNKALNKYFGSKHWMRRSASELLTKDKAESHIRDDGEAMKNGFVQVEEKFESSDGRMHEYETRKFAIHRTNNKPLLGGIAIDVTERNLLETTHKMQLEKQLKILNTTKDKLLSIIAHDLRNPIGNIVNFSELLKKDSMSLTPKSSKYIEVINTSAEQTLNLLEDLVVWSKSHEGNIEFKPEKVNVADCLTEVHEILRASAVLKNINISISIQKDLICYADKQMLKTIFRNLIQNAIKFTNSGGIIEVNAISEQNNIRFTVSDNGIGMDSEAQSNLFNLGENITHQGTSGEKGSGLGLILCKEFVEKHGGSIWVESAVGIGSKFSFCIARR
ncbi:MAG TPA: PAS domain S-box protein [Bacteroidales bacterium]|nr:PAS domain S-box protein [Bacteroidales bacterium]